MGVPEGLVHGVVQLCEQGHRLGGGQGVGDDAKACHEDYVQSDACHQILSLHILLWSQLLQPCSQLQTLVHNQTKFAPACID